MDKSDMQKKALTLEDLMAAESSVEILRHSQKNWYPEDVRALQNKLPVKRNSQLYKLDPILQEDILRVGGRLNKAAMPQNA